MKVGSHLLLLLCQDKTNSGYWGYPEASLLVALGKKSRGARTHTLGSFDQFGFPKREQILQLC